MLVPVVALDSDRNMNDFLRKQATEKLERLVLVAAGSLTDLIELHESPCRPKSQLVKYQSKILSAQGRDRVSCMLRDGKGGASRRPVCRHGDCFY